MTSSFVFATCQLGAEKTLLAELAPRAKLAFSRPGFLTLKIADFAPDSALKSIFSRSYGISLGKKKGTLEERVDFVASLAAEASRESEGALHLHVFLRDGFEAEAPAERPDFAEREIRARSERSFAPSGLEPGNGERVLDVILVDPDEWWVGFHVHGPTHRPWPGGIFRMPLPEEAPSRAFLKLEEALAWSRLPLERGDVAVEVGSAPGGASYALLRRGMKVVGVDPARMDARVLADPSFKHVRKTFTETTASDLPAAFQWLLCDLNGPPEIAAVALEKLAPFAGDSLLGIVATLKLNEWKTVKRLPPVVRRLGALGLAKVRVAQLSTNHQEVCAVGLTRRGALRAK